MNKKICFVTTGDIKLIATAKRALGMADPLTALGWDVSILMEDTEENRHRVSMECSKDIDVRFFTQRSAREEIRAKNALVREIDPDFLYYCALTMRNCVGVRHRSKKLVEHSELPSMNYDVKGLKRLRILALEYFSIFFADALIQASKFLQNTFDQRARRILHPKPLSLYLPYAYAEGVTQVKVIDRAAGKAAQFEGRKVFAFLGSITRNYGTFTIIEAIERIKERHPEVLMLFMGKGVDYEAACSYIEEHHLSDHIKMLGYVDEEDISFYFSLADYFISPMNDTAQDWARCPSKLYMYLPYNKPIITCKIGEPYETLRDKGIYYAPSSVEGLAREMEQLLASGRTELGIDASLHSWSQRSKEFNDWMEKNFQL